ncbi:MAG: NUDIX domain-containing protein [Idiomarina sp.]|nr:NUDIX domain-containing protein [Idiomarina sp.]
MKHLGHLVFPTLSDPKLQQPGNHSFTKVLERMGARGIVRREDKLLLLYTERYDDFSFPGGGVDPGEAPEVALVRELTEETGAQAIQVLSPFGKVTEYVPTWKQGYELMFQTSAWYHCDIAEELGQQQLEHYEDANGMRVCWVGLEEALTHNQRVLDRKPATMGQSIYRETFVLEQLLRSSE